MNWVVKEFNQLTNEELYEIIRLRVNVFIVEQNCPYEELDGADKKALHLFLKDEKGAMLAYSRLFLKGDYFEEASIGRVIVAQKQRSLGYGVQLLNKAISILEEEKEQKSIFIQAQSYLEKFYQSFGFYSVSESYMHDGLLHTDMRKERNKPIGGSI
ncbi:GNAT family acetyltransferase [Alkalihalobacillus alcalophilus ATCC 27647 = CGMCC 1.3604]|uniref:GNAT family acetyltransferase n=1 Tax=Alkalihalobacillus alcalophilus ATCC 27647 = CGMCC 1.3604 TaxID=1218173 RepID=A0A094WGC3_ALKAL|nr:GNAT family N-acetyltransferase [Alkalihalobacillus alcalophilus]KGA96784.1 GNAT family acetyltransferase [Alkalihalobacillus alcalophilus ATCC 27647 = CGMCC 1.3604]MED1564331.1 GNAT family N-acetyltransferase [Alkalihalobacillus alcalophilus]THG90203.1 GNAT family acetyltransferase [Alkalihalobacillus alcalophilus ATCC 27647 = CGMCC 1.3604]